jgi:hypothetical protein
MQCLGMWQKGKAVSFQCSKDVPKMLTPLYSYYLNYQNTIEIDSILFGTYKQAPEFSSWMEKHYVEAAVYMPTEFPNFPFKIPPKTKTQLATHEAFHIDIMLRYWYTNKGFWPKWDEQPDRDGIQSCYAKNDSVQELITNEQETLALLIESLLDNKKSIAIELGNDFLKLRKQRYASLADVRVLLSRDKQGYCKAAEGIMEIEEGIADYASWVKMYDIGVVTREGLLRRYRAKQNEKFYLTGCMLLHASALMNGGKDDEVIEKMVRSKSLEDGSLTGIFEEYFLRYSEDKL